MIIFVVIFSEVSDIFAMRMQQVSYVLDILATVPYDHIARSLGAVDRDAGLSALLSARRLIKIHRVAKFIY